MQITFIHYLLAFLGLSLYIVLGLWKAKKSHKENFNALVWLKDNLFSIIASVISVVILMMSIKDVFDLGVIPEQFTGLLNLVSVMFGYFNLSFLKKIFDIGNPKKLRKA